MSSRGWAAVAFVIVAAAGCSSGRTGGSPAAAAIERDKGAIDKTRNAYVSAWRAANAEDITRLYADDALVLYPNKPAVAGRAAILAYFQSFFAEFAQADFELTSAEIEVAGSWALDRGTYRWKGLPRAGGDPVEDHGKYLVILQRQADGSWKIARDMDNSDRPLAQASLGAG